MFNEKRRHFKKMLNDLKRTIWNKEFQRFKALSAREGLRRQYDQANDAFNRISQHPNLATDEKLQGEQKLIKDQVNLLKGQMDEMDVRINGQLPTETQEGVIGLTQELESAIEMREYIKAFVKHNT